MRFKDMDGKIGVIGREFGDQLVGVRNVDRIPQRPAPAEGFLNILWCSMSAYLVNESLLSCMHNWYSVR